MCDVHFITSTVIKGIAVSNYSWRIFMIRCCSFNSMFVGFLSTMICFCRQDEQHATPSTPDAAMLGGGGEVQEIPPKETPTLTPPDEKKPYIPKGMTLRQARHAFHICWMCLHHTCFVTITSGTKNFAAWELHHWEWQGNRKSPNILNAFNQDLSRQRSSTCDERRKPESSACASQSPRGRIWLHQPMCSPNGRLGTRTS